MRTQRFELRFTPDEKSAFEGLAKAQGLDLAGWVRAACHVAAERLGRPVTVENGK